MVGVRPWLLSIAPQKATLATVRRLVTSKAATDGIQPFNAYSDDDLVGWVGPYRVVWTKLAYSML